MVVVTFEERDYHDDNYMRQLPARVFEDSIRAQEWLIDFGYGWHSHYSRNRKRVWAKYAYHSERIATIIDVKD